MKRINVLLLIFSLFLPAGLVMQADNANSQIWVSPDGNDKNSGSIDAPKQSLHAALREAREYRRLNKVQGNALEIIMEDGVYPLHESLLIRPEDSGSEDCPTIIRAAENARPVLSGGIRIENWQVLKKAPKGLRVPASKVWYADVPKVSGRDIDFRQVYINGNKALKACDVENPDALHKILAVDKEKQEIRIPAPAVKKFQKVEGMEFFIHQMWEVAILGIESIKIEGKEAVLRFHQPASRLEFEHPWPPAVIAESGNSPFRLSGAIEFLDHEGEWYYDQEICRLYYMPRQGEDLTKAEVMVPYLETLIQVFGSLDRPVEHIHFEGIGFMHSTWMRPSELGYVPLQAGMYLLDAYKLPIDGTPLKANLENQAWIGRQPAAVQLSGVAHTSFERCRFQHLGASGLDYVMASCNDRIEGCIFNDIAGSGIVVGKFSDPGFETHLPYQPKDERELSRQMQIRNNWVYDCANEYWGCVGIIAGYVQNVCVAHNEVCELPYSGISIGWGWIRSANCMKDNQMIANDVHHFGRHNYSCGGLYTLSAQTGTLIAENYVHDIYHPDYVHDKTQGHYIYLDEASSWMTIRDNWCSEAKFGQNQPGLNHWENNGPQVNDSIKAKAGIQEHWQHIKIMPL